MISEIVFVGRTSGQTISIPTTLAVCLVVYFSGLYLFFLIFGVATEEKSKMNDFDFFAVILWPISILLFLLIATSDAVCSLCKKIPKGICKFIAKSFWAISLPFRPITLGREITKKFYSKKGHN